MISRELKAAYAGRFLHLRMTVEPTYDVKKAGGRRQAVFIMIAVAAGTPCIRECALGSNSSHFAYLPGWRALSGRGRGVAQATVRAARQQLDPWSLPLRSVEQNPH
jgi:hypothetical protein